jgi:hypothetical protein
VVCTKIIKWINSSEFFEVFIYRPFKHKESLKLEASGIGENSKSKLFSATLLGIESDE